MESFTVSYLKEVLYYELQILGYRKIEIKKKKNTLEVNADGLKAFVYNLYIVNPFKDVEDILVSVFRQLEMEKIKRGDTM